MSSSPFEIFRRNLKPLMVFLTILALFSFVVLPALDTYLRRGGGINSDPVAAVFDGTKLTRSRVARTTQNHAAVVRFLSELAGETLQRGGVPQTPGFQYDEQSGQIRSLGIDSNPGEEATINTLRFYNEAKKAGFELDDTALRNWLSRFTDGTMSDAEVLAILFRSSGNQLGQQHLYEQLRMHLLADLYQRGSLVGLTNGQMPVVTPLGQWQNFLKMNQKATVDVYGVLVSEYVDQTNDSPSQSEMEEVYKEGQDRLNYPSDTSPAPKFRRPDSARFEYVAADLNQFIEAEKAKLTEEQIRAEYERRIAGGDFQLPADMTSQDDSASQEEEATPPAKPANPEPAAQPETEKPKAETETSEAEKAEPKTAEPADEDSSMTAPTDTSVRLVLFQNEEDSESEGEPQTEASEAAETKKSADDKQAAEEKDNAPTQDAEMKAAEEKPAAEKAVEEKKAADAQATAEKAAAEKKAAEMKATEAKAMAEQAALANKAAEIQAAAEKAMAENAPQEKQAAEPTAAAEEAAAEKAAGDMKAAAKPAEAMKSDGLDLDDQPETTKAQSFEEVRDQIATEMATEPARRALDQAVTEAFNQMRKYNSRLAFHESKMAINQATPEDAPEKLNLKKMADELGLQYGKTDELVNRVTAEDTVPGGSFGLGSSFNRRGPPFAAMMFGAQMQDGSIIPPQGLFTPLRSVDVEAGVTYITWKTEDVEAYLPKLEDIRDEVIQVIRTREAREFAQAAAEKIAQAAAAEGKTLADVIPESKTENLMTGVGPFSWLEQVGFMQTVVSEVPQLDAVGQEFMQAVFSTSVGNYDVAPNDPQSVYYVIKPTEFQPDMDALHQQFQQPQQRFMAQLLGNDDARNIVRGFYEAIDERTGFELKLAEDQN